MFNIDNLKVILVTGIILVIVWFVGEGMYELMVDLYHFLDNYIYAFFAGIIAFFLAIWLCIIMVQITVVAVLLLIGVLTWVISLFN